MTNDKNNRRATYVLLSPDEWKEIRVRAAQEDVDMEIMLTDVIRAWLTTKEIER